MIFNVFFGLRRRRFKPGPKPYSAAELRKGWVTLRVYRHRGQ